MPSPMRWPDAALAGLACSMRTLSGPAALAARGQLRRPPRLVMLACAVGELGVDKARFAPDRTAAPALAGRIGTGALTGHAIAGPVGAGVAALSAGIGTFSSWRVRTLVVRLTGLPDPMIAAVEDIVCYAAAALATQSLEKDAPRDEVAVAQISSAVGTPSRPSVGTNALRGLMAGVVGTAVMNIAQGAEFVLTRAQPSHAAARVPDRLLRQLSRGRIGRRRRSAANQGMRWLYGSAWGIPYGVFAASSRTRPEITGPAFGLIVFAVGLAQQPALGLADPPWERSLQSLGSEALFHAVYGVGAAAAMRALRNV